MTAKAALIATLLAAADIAVSASSPPKFTDCRSCVEAGLKWQEAGKSCAPTCLIADAGCIDERNIDLCDDIPPERPWNMPFDPDMYKNCQDCTKNLQKWFNGKCRAQCPPDARGCVSKPDQCPKQCDCYVDLRRQPNYQLDYINMWANKPCERSLGALYQGRCLLFANGVSKGKPRTANCGAGKLQYVRLRTESGKSVGWVAEKYLVCRQSGNKPPNPPPAPVPAAGQSQLPKAPSSSDKGA